MADNGDLARMPGSTVKVYLVLKSYAHFVPGQAFPEIPTIAEKSGLSVSQVIRCLKNLVAMGFLRTTRNGRKNIYHLYEKVVVRDETGRTAAMATWEYQPQKNKQTVTDLNQIVGNGELDQTHQIIHIKNVQVQINKADLDKLAGQDPKFVEQLLSIRARMLMRNQHEKT
jgi:DNA-binding transcriptional MocR family regulator